MIHFFRRIRQSLLEGNKFKKYLIYAIGEIALVMIGILLALQVNNWNQNKKIQNIEQTLQLDLREEFVHNDSLLQETIAKIDRNLESMKRALYYTGPDVSDISHSEMSNLIKGVSKNKILYYPNTSVLDDIVNSGQLQYLTDKVLRRSLSTWQGFLKNTESQENIVEAYRDELKRLTYEKSDLMSHFQLEKVEGLDTIDTGISNHDFNSSRLLSDQQFENLVLYKIASTGSLRLTYLRLQSYMKSILEHIDQELNNSI